MNSSRRSSEHPGINATVTLTPRGGLHFRVRALCDAACSSFDSDVGACRSKRRFNG